MSIRWKIFIPIAITIFGYLLLMVVLTSTTVSGDMIEQNEQFAEIYVDEIHAHITSFYTETERQGEILRNDVERRLEELVQSVTGMLQGLHQMELDGDLTRAEAQEMAVEQINNMWFGLDGYFWIDTTEHINVALPPDPSVVGTSRFDLTDRRGTKIIQEMVSSSLEQGTAWVEYYFPKPGESEPSLKLGHTRLFEPWNWVVGTGEYIDNIEEELQAIRQESIRELNTSLYANLSQDNYPIIVNSEGEFVAYVDQSVVGTNPNFADALSGESLNDLFQES
ncbi:cache domain-containing protein [Salinispira pacifica]|uniref:Single Cache domain-containing protein n=1 Tax=Salinispira pacifica TaxID=1307761 RepID=V5WKS1_9SPIO|nr:cache domain-containing protein [Salinispira pacifica]AHC15791.1 hypothetical protein L21SP2_2438 [Salinispira pacifica]